MPQCDSLSNGQVVEKKKWPPIVSLIVSLSAGFLSYRFSVPFVLQNVSSSSAVVSPIKHGKGNPEAAMQMHNGIVSGFWGIHWM